MSKILTIALTAALAVGAAGCSSGPQAAQSSGGSATTLKISTTSDDLQVPAAVEQFMKDNPDVEIDLQTAPTDAVMTNIRTQLTSGTAPDLFVNWPGDGSPAAVRVVAAAGYLEDLSDQPWVADLPDSVKPLLGLDGKTYLASSAVAAIPAIYNDSALEEVGASAPQTWSEVIALCETARSAGKVAFALGNQTPWNTQLVNYALAATLVYGPDPGFADEMAAGNTSFADSTWSEVMDKYLEMNESGCFNDDPLGVTYESALAAVGTGDALGIVMVNSAVTAIKEAAPEGATFSSAPLPATEDPADTVMPLAAGNGLVLNAKSENKELGKEFLAYMMSPEGLEVANTAAAGLPSIPVEGFAAEPALDGVLEFQKADRVTPFMDQRWPNARVQQTHFTEVQKLFSGSATVPEALGAMDQAYQQK